MPSGAVCRSLPTGGIDQTAVDAAWVDATGKVFLSAYRIAVTEPGTFWFVAEADGPVSTAILAARTDSCRLDAASLFDGRYAVRAARRREGVLSGVLAGSFAEAVPRVAFSVQDAVHSPYASPFSIIDLTSDYRLEQYSWNDGTSLGALWSPAQDNGLQQGPFAFARGAIFWSADNLNYIKVNSYTPDGGVRSFLSAGLVVDPGYSDLGTDGKDLVWIEARGRTSGGLTKFGTYEIMTSKYTASPAALKPRRLRSEPGTGLGITNFVVGCGYAARSDGRHLRLVRLADGASWVLSGNHWQEPFAVTCEELFASVYRVSGNTVGRIRIDSLGAPLPPD